MHIFELDDVVALLRSEVSRAGGQAAWAKETGVDRVIVNRILNGQRPPTRKIISALKLRMVFVRATRVSCSTPADVDKKIDRRIERRRSKPIEAAAPRSTGRCGNEVTTTNTKLAGERPRPQP